MIFFGEFGAGIPLPSAGRYWRLKFPSGSPGLILSFSEIEMRGTVGGSDLATSTATASSGTASNAFDNNTGTEWSADSGTDVGSWIATDLGSANDIAEIVARSRTIDPDYGPSEITVEYSVDNSTWYQDTRWPTYTSLTWANGTTYTEAKRLRRATAPGIAHMLQYQSSPDSNEGGWTNFTIRQVITAARMPNGGGTDRIRFAFRAADAEGFTINKCYVQIKGAGTYDFNAAPVQVTFDGGSNSTTLSSGTTKYCDAVTLSLTDSDAIVVSIFVPSGSSAADALKKVSSPGTGVTGGYKSGDDASNQTPSGYTAWNFGLLVELEIWDN